MWEQLQSFSRLQSPTEEGQLQIRFSDPAGFRRDTLGVIERVKTLREDFRRHCRDAASNLINALHPTLGKDLQRPLQDGVSLVSEMRRALADATTRANDDLKSECRLADEFLSHGLLDMLAAAQRTIDDILLSESSRVIELESKWIQDLRECIMEMLGTEVGYRRLHDYYYPRADAPNELARFIERGSMLKKHFQDVLFLDNEAVMVDFRVRNWTGIFAASLAAALWFGFTLLPIGPGARFSLAGGTFAMAFALAYALKDRVKELGRVWLTRRLVSHFGQRNLRLRQPGKGDRPTIIEARETLDCQSVAREDSLNRNVGQTRRVVVIKYHMRAEASAFPKLTAAGMGSIRHIFRYDLSPIFSRLDDAVKRILLLDESTGLGRFADAPKEYRFPLRLSARVDGTDVDAIAADLVVKKGGIVRLDGADAHGD